MSILDKLRSCHDIYDAGRIISKSLGEPVNHIDVLSLAIEGHLTISAKLVNGAWGRRCNEVKIENVELKELPTLDGTGTINVPTSGHLLILEEKLYHVDGDVVSLDGIFDLPMIGGERIDVEFTFHQLQFQPEPQHVSLEGVLVRHESGQLFELQERFNTVRDWRVRIGDPSNFHPAGALPEDRIFVIRKKMLDEFLSAHSELPEDERKKVHDQLSSREKTTLLNIVGTLLEALDRKESSLISELIEKYPDVPGIAKRTLEQKFAEAKRSLNSR